MRKASWMALLTIGTLLPASAFGEDPEAPVDDAHIPSEPDRVAANSVSEYRYETPWYLTPDTDALSFPDDSPFTEVDFYDSSAFGRLSRLRSLSLLTFAEFGDGRLFFGVNNDGLLGLHFGASSDDGDQGELELARMPYLEDPEPGIDDR